MFDHSDNKILWVSASSGSDRGDGTFEEPFDSIDDALAKVEPGYTIVLMQGTYSTGINFEVSGTIQDPIRIAADDGALVEVKGACWFFYDTSDMIVSGITFRDAPFGAISVIGNCSRNLFEKLHFVNCGTEKKASSTIYFGGSGGTCNVVEDCVFEHAARKPGERGTVETSCVGLMVSEGDADHGAPITDHVYRKNRFVNYDYGILVGANDTSTGLYGHLVEFNTIENCSTEGILVKCGDTQVRGNLVRNCGGDSISIVAGCGSIVAGNRIVDCGSGIKVHDADHSITNNCIIRCLGQGIRVCGASQNPDRAPATNLFVEKNTFVDCGTDGVAAVFGRVAGIRIDPGTSCVITKNLIAGNGSPIAVTDLDAYRKERGHTDVEIEPVKIVINETVAACGCTPSQDVSFRDITFPRCKEDDYTNDSGCGASGWVLTPATFDPELDTVVEGECYCTPIDDDDEYEPEDEASEEAPPERDFDSFMAGLYPKDFGASDSQDDGRE